MPTCARCSAGGETISEGGGKEFETHKAFLRRARELLREEMFVWPRRHMQGHDVPLVEALRIIYEARPEDVRPDRAIPRRYLVWGRDASGRLLRVVLEILPGPSGDVLVFVTAFDEHRKWGS